MRELDLLVENASTRRVRVALDIEGVIADITTPVLKLYNEMHGTNWKAEDVTDWGFKSINTGAHEVLPLFNRVWIERHGEIRYEANSRLINELRTICEVDIVTSRTGVDDQIVSFVNSNGLSSVPIVIHPPTSEKTVLNYDVYIDDSPTLADAVVKSDHGVLLLVDRPWNRSNVPENDRIMRVADTNAAVKEIFSAIRRSEGGGRRIKA
jgi:5'(3')-deoxyribonucleotidase